MKTRTKLLIAGLVVSHALIGGHFYSKGREFGREEVLSRLRNHAYSVYEKAYRTYSSLPTEQKKAFLNHGDNVNRLIEYLKADGLNQRLDAIYELEKQLVNQSATLIGKLE